MSRPSKPVRYAVAIESHRRELIRAQHAALLGQARSMPCASPAQFKLDETSLAIRVARASPFDTARQRRIIRGMYKRVSTKTPSLTRASPHDSESTLGCLSKPKRLRGSKPISGTPDPHEQAHAGGRSQKRRFVTPHCSGKPVRYIVSRQRVVPGPARTLRYVRDGFDTSQRN